MDLVKVTLDKTDTCLTYCLKRMDKPYDFCTFDTYHEFFNQYPYARKHKTLERGDIILWDKDTRWEWLPWSINDKIEWRNIPTGFHFAIYEGDGYFSDCTRLVRPPHPSLRFRNLKDLKKNPDWILRLDESIEE